MKKIYVVLDGRNGFHLEKELSWNSHIAPPVYMLNEYQQLSCSHLSWHTQLNPVYESEVNTRYFRKKQEFDATGKHIAYYQEDIQTPGVR